MEGIVSFGAVNNHPGFQDIPHLTGAGGLIYPPGLRATRLIPLIVWIQAYSY